MGGALFLDRDGVINVDRGYVCTRDQFEFVDGIFDLCRHAATLGFAVVVVTNQAGIGRGYYTEREFLQLTDWMCASFSERGVPIARVYSCPYHPEFGIGSYKRKSDFRKPGPGMILQAAKDLTIALPQSVLVGDRETDIEAGRAAGVGVNLLYRPQTEEDPATSASQATATLRRLVDAVPFLERLAIHETMRSSSCMS
jgi:D-glycero-D-manno-heptose 1,7-bisphosphate phosphatase